MCCVTEVLKQNQCQSNPKSAPNNGFFYDFMIKQAGAELCQAQDSLSSLPTGCGLA